MNINLKKVSKSYEQTVLDDISLDLKGYNTIAVIGKSGCGKSTLLRLMTGIESARQGLYFCKRALCGQGEYPGLSPQYRNGISTA